MKEIAGSPPCLNGLFIDKLRDATLLTQVHVENILLDTAYGLLIV